MVANYKVKTKKERRIGKIPILAQKQKKNVQYEGQSFVHYGWRIWNHTKENQDWMN